MIARQLGVLLLLAFASFAIGCGGGDKVAQKKAADGDEPAVAGDSDKQSPDTDVGNAGGDAKSKDEKDPGGDSDNQNNDAKIDGDKRDDKEPGDGSDPQQSPDDPAGDAKSEDPDDKPQEEPSGGATDGDTEPAAEAGGPAAVEPAVESMGSERVVLLTAAGPLLVELKLSIDGRPHPTAMSRLVDYILKAGDTDGDGKATWEELTTSPRFRYGQFGNAAINSESERMNMIRMYDSNRNGRVDAAEAPRFLTRNAGGSQPFSFMGSNYFKDVNKSKSATLMLLDSDEDYRLSAAEMSAAAARLRSRDQDGDDTLYANELADPNEEAVAPLSRRRSRVPESAIRVSGRKNLSEALYALEEYYAFSRKLTTDVFEIAPQLGEFLDENGDDVIDRKEIERLTEAPPQVQLEARFGDPDDDAAQFKLSHVDENLRDKVINLNESENRITLQLDGFYCVFFYTDSVSQTNASQQADAALQQFDENKDGYLDEDELPDNFLGVMEPLLVLDLDNDEKIYPKELTEYYENSQVAYRSQIRSRAGETPDALFEAIDADNDGRISAREIDGLAERLKAIDRDDNGELTIDEIPDSMAFGVTRGNPQQATALFAVPVARPQASGDAPRWFQRMDRNSDGVVGEREFLGEGDQFSELDKNSDGYLEPAEVAPPSTAEAETSEPETDQPEAKEPAETELETSDEE